MAVVDYANFIVEALETDGFPDRVDAWQLRQTDTGEQYIHVGGAWLSLALGLSFAPPTKSGQVVTNANAVATVTFGTPFKDANYTVSLTCQYPGGNQPPIALITSKTADGFTIQTVYSRTGNNSANITVCWLCTRNHNT